MGLDLSGTELSYKICLLFEGMGMEDWGVVEGVGHPYVAKGHLVSGQVKEKEGGMAVWNRPGRGERPTGTMDLPYMASNGLIFKDFFGKAWTFKRAKGRNLVQS